MRDVVLRDAAQEDCAALAAVLQRAHAPGSALWREWSDPEKLKILLFAVASPKGRATRFRLRVAQVGEEVAGAMMSRWAYDRLGPTEAIFGDIGLIDTLAVLPAFRRHGVGRALVKDAEAELRRAGVRVAYAESTPGAVPFYEALRYRAEPEEVRAITFFPRQGPKLYTHCIGDLSEARLVWKSLTGGMVRSSVYEHPDGKGPGVALTGLIPGDARRTVPWPEAGVLGGATAAERGEGHQRGRAGTG
ncbi:GNAT family N-acetyltransferase [Streptomyces violaceusniger]|uniref:GNAT family N-acetyltransferase n=1 Tax=Streptomyces violaceusniger TaxID=68280 RepID=UPI00031FF1D3|nr:GNAT family N-acetyltransferase [Streptomyces violaceusniger]